MFQYAPCQTAPIRPTNGTTGFLAMREWIRSVAFPVRQGFCRNPSNNNKCRTTALVMDPKNASANVACGSACRSFASEAGPGAEILNDLIAGGMVGPDGRKCNGYFC